MAVKNNPFFLLTLVTVSLLSACVTVGPDYQKPELEIPGQYSVAPTGETISGRWWQSFQDPVLDSLVAEALAGNQDLALAAARVEEARAFAGLARADQLPEVGVSATASRTRQSDDLLPPGSDAENNYFNLSAGLSYELDFWGRFRRLSEAARAELLATEEGRRNVVLGLQSEVAASYFDLLSLDVQYSIARATLESRNESVRLQTRRFESGTISELDLSQAQAELAATEATIPVLERSIRLTENRLLVLLGRTGGRVIRAGTFDQLIAPEVPVGLPSALLERRPDVFAAEQALVAANARIGAARASYFPSITLTGQAGTESLELANLFTPGTGIWQAAASLFQPVFNGGRIRRQVEVAEAREDQAMAVYRKSIQVAFSEVEDALVSRQTAVSEREALARQVETLERARHLAEIRYEAGESSYLEVLDAERNLFQAQLGLTDARRSELTSAVTLFRALGGGWDE